MSKLIIDIAEFWGYLTASALVKPDQLRPVWKDFQARFPATSPDSLATFTDYLVARQVLTNYQVSKLTNGQYKGFFLDQFMILDKSKEGDHHSRFVARDTLTNQIVILCVKPPATRRAGESEYWVE